MPFLWKLGAFFRRDLITDVSYRLSFALEAVHAGIAVAAYYFLSQLIGPSLTGGYSSFAFLLVGMCVNAYMTTCFVCFSQAIRGSQSTGALKMVLATPTSPTTFLVCSSAYPLMRAGVDAALYIATGLLLGLAVLVNPVSTALVLILSLLAFSSIGITAATFVLVFKRGDPLLWLFGSASWLLGGVLYPTSLLPSGLQQISAVLPVTHAVSGLRAALLDGASPAQISGDLAALAVFTLIAAPMSVAIFAAGINHARHSGTLDHQ